jgi:molybdate transport system substrate-binding protein
MRMLVVVVLLLLVAGGAFALRRAQVEKAAYEGTLYLAVPQGLFLPVSKVMDKYTELHPKVQFETMVDTPEAMVQAVEENKEKPDIFISPGGHEIEVLRKKGYIDPKTEVAFGSYDLAVLVPKGNPGKVKRVEDLLNPEVKVISISDPEVNAACYAARQSLQNLGLWEKLKPKLKVTGCCMSSFRWILDGRAEANIQFLGCPLDPKTAETAEKEKVLFACGFPKDTFYVPRNVAGILKSTKKRAMAERFLAYLTSPEIIKFMADNRMRNDRDLPHTPGPWGPAQEAGPAGRERAAR